jgi:hypothetical protein
MVMYIPTCSTSTDDCGICGSALREYSAPSPWTGEVMQYSKLVREPSLGESPLSSVLDPMKAVTHPDGNSLLKRFVYSHPAAATREQERRKRRAPADGNKEDASTMTDRRER